MTILCEDCKKLYDIVDGWNDPKKRQPKLRCPKSKTHNWREWTSPDKCPTCGAEMQIDPNGIEALWD
jgi:DNA-directed RNA polymerase subunit RPC12/RpoP